MIAEASLRIVYYTPWQSEDGAFTDEQRKYMVDNDVLNAAYCDVTIAEYTQEVIRQ